MHNLWRSFGFQVSCHAPRQPASWSLDDLPRALAFTLHQGSNVTSMDFHPSHQTLLLVGLATGEITLWEVRSREKLVSKPFKVWGMASCSLQCQTAAMKDAISTSRVTWSPDGNYVGMFHSGCFDAHAGGVNDLAFANPNNQLCVITCGDDKVIKVWDFSGRKLYTFEGHEAPVYSICPHFKENIQFIFSTAIDGKIKAWLYDNAGSRVAYDAPGQWCATMLYRRMYLGNLLELAESCMWEECVYRHEYTFGICEGYSVCPTLHLY